MKKQTTISQISPRRVLDLREYLQSANHSLLCSGPMSKNCVDAVIAIANESRRPFPLIASRRQIESAEFGGGYVNNWNSKTFADYVKSKDKGFVHICRDHGGPWQGVGEANLPQRQAMERAKAALLDDLTSGFDVLHLDPSICGVPLTDGSVTDMLFELYTFVIETSRQLGVEVEIEVGAEQQSGYFSDPRELVTMLKEITNFCTKRNYKKPLFCVVQTGTLVKEMRNVGMTEGRKNEAYDQKYAVESMEKAVQFLVDISRINGVFVKEHNGDYLSDGSMLLRRRLEVGAVNIAPQYGVCESKSLLGICAALGLKKQADAIIEVFYNSKKWDKWLSVDSKASDLDKALIAGHYTFAKPEFLAIKAEVAAIADRRGINLDDHLMQNIKGLLQQHAWNLGYYHSIYSRVEKVTTEVVGTKNSDSAVNLSALSNTKKNDSSVLR